MSTSVSGRPAIRSTIPARLDRLKVPLYGLAFSVGNLLGPLILGPLFDSVGRKKMISGTYLLSALSG